MAPLSLLTGSGGQAAVSTPVSAAAVVPPTSRFALARLVNTGTSSVRIGMPGVAPFLDTLIAGDEKNVPYLPLDASQQFSYFFVSAPTSGGFFAQVLGYFERR